MAVCANGASVKAGVDGNTYVPIDASTYNLITNLPLPWWASVMAYLLTPFEMKVSDICAANADDPAAPGPDVWAKALMTDPTAQQTVVAFLRAKLQYYQFQQNCVCNSPAPGTPCQTETATPTTADCTYGVSYLGSHSCYVSNHVTGWTGGASRTVAIPSGLHHISITSPNLPTYDGQIEVYTATLAEGVCHGPFHPNAAIDLECNLPVGDSDAEIVLFNQTNGNIVPMQLVVGWSPAPGEPACSGGAINPPGTVTQPTTLVLPGAPVCGSYQDICNALLQTNLKLDFLMRSVPPVNYLSRFQQGTVHSGLTGSGNITVSGIPALYVTLNTVPSLYGTEAGVPPTRWNTARISWSDPYGVLGQQWVGETAEILLPLTTTLIGYYFAPGVAATITELIAGK